MSLGRENLVKLMFFSRQCWRRTGRRGRTALDLSVSGAKGAWLASVWVSVRVMRSTLKDPRGGSWGGRGGGGRTTTVMAEVRLSVSSIRVCVVVVTLSVLLTLAVVLPARVAGMTFVFVRS